ncbi:YicC/YloC family endoribonuclease [Cytobacillus gottheilii]|uniref:YicC family protein n=1 Tax=Cytobacillus gottheilii TaxID=859144 RepID=A0ABX8FGS3_9BACI|nr:YicC/YloC family endoribonuclease [Cytobacillus gottheilii]QVY63229.1 YicC family protein [Cytobacillus gottheilii]
MVRSMTGFGRSKKEHDLFTITIEIKTVNHRFAEYMMRLPKQYVHFEEKVKKRLSKSIKRGRIEIFSAVTKEGDSAKEMVIDWPLLHQYYENMKKISEKYDLPGLAVQDLMREEFLYIEESEVSTDEFEPLFIEAVEEACQQLVAMRMAEGEELKKDFLNLLSHLQSCISQLKEYAPSVVLKYEERLKKKMQEYLSGELDESRIAAEAAIFADKSDINEELTRLQSHIHQFRQTFETEGSIGRKLDFLLQEMNREANTIGAKANDAHIASEVVEMKSLLEKMKEQVQNIE